MRILVTGGSGFIGRHFVRYLLDQGHQVMNFDKASKVTAHMYGCVDICSAPYPALEQFDAIAHLAAETHVDNSLNAPQLFAETNVGGTARLLDEARRTGIKRFLHVSTDEVYGPAPEGVYFKEDAPLLPHNPYSASKAGGEMMCRAFYETWGLPVVIARPVNNLGPHQALEKFIPKTITNALQDKPVTIYGDGHHKRDWLYVLDTCRALDLLLHEGVPGEAYNISANQEEENTKLASDILSLLDKPYTLLEWVDDRQGHDRRYGVDASKIRALGWEPRYTLSEALTLTVSWYRENVSWWAKELVHA